MKPLAAALLAVFVPSLWAADWTDRAEYDLVLAIRSEAGTAKRLALLDQWKAKYPASPLRQERRELYLAAYMAAGDTIRMLDVVKEMLADRPDSVTGAYWCSVLVPGASSDSRELWGPCEKAARQLVASGKAPSRDLTLLARRAIGWIHWQREEYPQAEAELAAYLRDDPANAEVRAWLGAVLALQKQPEKTVASLWYLARAASLTGAGSLPESQKRKAAGLLETVYTSYHGSGEGLEELRAAAAKSATPPAGFTVEPAAAVAARRWEETLRSRPEVAAWLEIRKRLEAADGADYFAASLRDKPLPKLKGTLSGFSPAQMPSELTFAIVSPGVEEVVVKLTAPLAGTPMRGQVMEFEGVGESFNRDPFVLVIRAERDKVTVSQ